MSTRYLIGTGARNVSNTAIWSDVSGGTGGFSAPTQNDAVIFDSNSGTGALTLDQATAWGSLDSTLLSGIVTITASVYTLSMYGSWTIHGTFQKFAFTGTSYFYQKGTGTITANGNLFLALNRLYIDGVGITVTNGDNCNFGNTAIYHTNGEWNQNSKIITTTNSYYTATGTKTLTLGNSSFYVNRFKNESPSGFTFNYNTGTVVVTSTISNNNIDGINTFYNLSLIGSTITAWVMISANQTINNTLTITGANATSQRVLIQSNTIGTPRTITCNGTTNITNCDFQDINGGGSANRDFSAQTDIGNCGGNTGITFPPAIDCYIKHTSGAMSVSNVAKWVTTDGGSTQARVPLPQDRAWGTVNSFTGASTVTMDCPRIGSIDLSGVTQTVTWALANAISCYGNYVLGSNIAPSGNFALTLSGRSNYNINLYGKSLYRLYVNSSNGNYINNSNIIVTSEFSVIKGTLDINDYDSSIYTVYPVITGTIIMGNGTFSIYGILNGFWNMDGGGTIFPEGSKILFNIASGSNNIGFYGGNKTYNIVQFSGSHTGNFDITGNNTFNNIKIDAGRKVRFTAGTTQTLLTPLDATGTAANPITIQGVTAAEHTLNYTGTSYIQCDYLNLTNSKVLPVGKWFAGKNSVNVSGNVNWLFRRYIMMPIITIIRKL